MKLTLSRMDILALACALCTSVEYHTYNNRLVLAQEDRELRDKFSALGDWMIANDIEEVEVE